MSRKTRRALAHLRTRVLACPVKPSLRMRLAEALLADGDKPAARTEYLVAARLFVRQGDAVQAQRVYQAMLFHWPDDDEIIDACLQAEEKASAATDEVAADANVRLPDGADYASALPHISPVPLLDELILHGLEQISV